MYPHFNYVEDKWLARKVYNKLSVRYVLAISCIAIMIISNQLVARRLMSKQLTDSRVINVAGRQRMLSQKITKEALLLYDNANFSSNTNTINSIDSSYTLWINSHNSLQNGDIKLGLPGNNSHSIDSLFNSIQPHFEAISKNYLSIKELFQHEQFPNQDKLKEYISHILEHENQFLQGMDQIVFQFDSDAKDRVSSLMRLENTLLFIALAVLVLEILFIFKPTAVYTKAIVNELIESEEKQKKLQSKLLNKKSKEQKILTSMFFEGQERERRRIARDLHDGIGQLMTGLKFQIEAIDTHKSENIVTQIVDIKEQAADIIKEIRRVSFDLRPTVLSDYGLTSALRNLIQELNKFTDISISFTNETDFDIRMEKTPETQVFRIVQESINNALKYSKANEINVCLSHSKEYLNITVQDNGSGFDLEQVRKKDYELRKGHGLFNMYERSGFLDADLEINTKPGHGTKIKLKIPLPRKV